MKNTNKKEKSRILLFYAAFAIILILATTAPHIIHWDGLISAKYAQSLVILLDLIIGYFLFQRYSKKLNKINKEKRLFENRLAESYKYIGKAHGEVEVLDIFFGYLQRFNKNAPNNKNFFTEILALLVVSVVKGDRGIIRFVNITSGRTITEYFFSRNNNQLKINLSNGKIIKNQSDAAPDSCMIISSDFDFGGLKCVLVFPRPTTKPNIELLKLLLNQIHSFFVTLKIESAKSSLKENL